MDNGNHNEIYHQCKGWHHWDLAGKFAVLGKKQALDHLEVAEFHFAIAGEDQKKIMQHIRVIAETYFEHALSGKMAPLQQIQECREYF